MKVVIIATIPECSFQTARSTLLQAEMIAAFRKRILMQWVRPLLRLNVEDIAEGTVHHRAGFIPSHDLPAPGQIRSIKS